MNKRIRFVGLDVHKETLSVAVAASEGEAISLGTIPNDPDAIGKLVRKLLAAGPFVCCYEAGPTGYVLYWQLTRLGVDCMVVAPSLVPVKPGDRVKTDRRDALKLARLFRAGELTGVWIPTPEHEALRDLVRTREAAKKDERRARNRLQKFLLRRGIRKPGKMRDGSESWRVWLSGVRFDHAAQTAVRDDLLREVEHAAQRIKSLDAALDVAIAAAPAVMRAVIDALQAMRGLNKLSAATIVSEVGPMARFEHPRQLMSYSGDVPSEHSSGNARRQGVITKTGNAHLRRVIGEAAWHYRHRPRLIGQIRKRQAGLSSEITDIAWNAQVRLNKRHRHLLAKGKPHNKVVTAVAREMLGFIWNIATHVELAAAAQT